MSEQIKETMDSIIAGLDLIHSAFQRMELKLDKMNEEMDNMLEKLDEKN